MQVMFATYNSKYLHCSNPHRLKVKIPKIPGVDISLCMGISNKIEVATITTDEATILGTKAKIALPFSLI